MAAGSRLRRTARRPALRAPSGRQRPKIRAFRDGRWPQSIDGSGALACALAWRPPGAVQARRGGASRARVKAHIRGTSGAARSVIARRSRTRRAACFAPNDHHFALTQSRAGSLRTTCLTVDALGCSHENLAIREAAQQRNAKTARRHRGRALKPILHGDFRTEHSPRCSLARRRVHCQDGRRPTRPHTRARTSLA